MRATVVLVALFMAAHAGAVRAASLPVVIEQLNAAAKACGIAEPSLETVARRTLENSRWQPDADAGGSLSVRANVTLASRSACAARITVRMKAFAKPLHASGTANPRERPRGPRVVLCAKSGTYSSPKAVFALEVESAVEHSIKECLGSLKHD
jgi:hypothetical protein